MSGINLENNHIKKKIDHKKKIHFSLIDQEKIFNINLEKEKVLYRNFDFLMKFKIDCSVMGSKKTFYLSSNFSIQNLTDHFFEIQIGSAEFPQLVFRIN